VDELIGPHLDGAYLSFDTEQGDEQVQAAFPPATLGRLRAIKAEVDPDNVFRDNANVLAGVGVAGAVGHDRRACYRG
jgi:hypothetical protein